MELRLFEFLALLDEGTQHLPMKLPRQTWQKHRHFINDTNRITP